MIDCIVFAKKFLGKRWNELSPWRMLKS